jgi:N-acetylmuramoyl-L-alanine amidase
MSHRELSRRMPRIRMILATVGLVGLGATTPLAVAEDPLPAPIPVEPGVPTVVSPEVDPNAPTEPPGGQVLVPPGERSSALIAIDPGHGGADVGAVGLLPDSFPTGLPERLRNGKTVIYEKDVNLDIAQRLDGWLRGRGFLTLMTRTQDLAGGDLPYRNVGADLSARVRIANAAKADLFISIHANALTKKSTGTETFRFYSATGAANRLAQSVHRQVVDRLQLPDRGVKRAGFYVLRNTKAPAILVESAFLSNPKEAELLAQPGVRQQVADAVGTGLALHLADEPAASTRPNYWVTAGRFRTKKLADRRVVQAKRAGFEEATVRGRRLGNRKVAFHVRVGEFVALGEAKLRRDEVKTTGLPGKITSARPARKVATGRRG